MSNDQRPSNSVSDQKSSARKPEAQTQAERSKAYRDRQQAEGLKSVKCFLAPDQMAYLKSVCQIHNCTIAEAISLAMTCLMKGTFAMPPAASATDRPDPDTRILSL
jgi:hypothetical protein